MDARNLVEHYNQYFDQHPSTILEFGAYDLRDALILAEAYPEAKVYSFEANPELYDLSVNNNRYPERIFIKNAAVFNENTKINFYVTPANVGASSVLKWSSFVPWTEDTTTHVIEVDAIRLDSFLDEQNIPTIDLMWMDAQGAELLCLQGLGTRIENVKMIQTEVGIQAYYEGHTLYPDIKKYLEEHGFEEILYSPDWSHESNVVFINKKFKKNLYENVTEHFIASEDSSIHWEPFDSKDHVVLDIGCGRWGVDKLEETSPIYFANQGAVRVIGVDMNYDDIQYYKTNTEGNDKYIFICDTVTNRTEVVELINEYNPTALKIDIEGWETALLECSAQELENIREIAIEYHSVELNRLSYKKIVEWGFTPHTVSKFPWGGDVNGVWYGRR